MPFQPPSPSRARFRFSQWAGIALMALMAALALGNTILLIQSQLAADHTMGTLRSIDHLMRDLVTAESGQKDFAVTHKPDSLEPYERAVAGVPIHLGDLVQRLRGHLAEAATLSGIETLVKQKLGELDQIVNLLKQGRQAEAEAQLKTGAGRQVMDDVKGRLEGLRALEEHQLSQRERITSFLSWVVLIFTTLTAATGMTIGWISNRRVHSEMEARERAFEEVEQLVEKRTADLRTTMEELKLANAAKTDFLAVMSHEMRTPLNTVLGYAQLLDDDLPASLRAEYIASIRAGSSALLGVINDVLDFAKIEQGEIELIKEPVDVRRFFEDILLALRPPIDPERLRAEFDPAVAGWMLVDQDKLRQIVINLLGNALKFDSSGVVTLRVACPADRLEVTVSDHGIGIAPAALPAIFDAFTQAESTTRRRFGGSGLGLAICRRYVEAMGGEISVESSVGKGSRFSFWIKREDADAAPPAPASPAIDLPHLRVLVVEDNGVNLRLGLAMLRRCGVIADGAAGGAECLSRLQQQKYDLIFMDIEMPGMDGFDTTRAIRQMTLDRRPAIVALTGDVVADVESRCYAAGMDGYLSKPIQLESLRQTLVRFAG